MTEEETVCYRQKLVKFLVALRDVGLETKFHIYDILLDPNRTRKRKSQFITVAIVSKEEVIEENFSVLEKFTDYLHGLHDPSALVTKVVHYERVAFAMNAGEKYFFEHGECRVFDPYRKFLFKIIDEETSQKKRNKRKEPYTRKGIHTLDKGGLGVLENMENAYMKIYNNINDAVILLFSFYIPCSIDFHDCARVLQEFVKASGHKLVIGFEHIHHLTDRKRSLKWLEIENITVVSNKELERQLSCQLQGLLRQNDDDIGWVECDGDVDNTEDVLHAFCDDVHGHRVGKHSRCSGKMLCRRILKQV
ncbi:uncharacterized protein LOC132734834 isoform X1 [Ruditapes philippinarum]|uniref:uncharacterized protein LOC132734834 isoform X1 n=1 Tax=Ruditapes philippinarum TaxID=129788 RepID=UPI00295BCCEA|nr:uncharacterized protein LOC132734834 isoform X1 [Ruditapes philippinarum]